MLLILQRNLFVVVGLIFVLLWGCSNDKKPDTFQGVSFNSKEEAVEHFKTEENIKGKMILVQTTKKDEILIAEYNRNEYTLGSFVKKDGKYKVLRISGIHSLRNVPGAGWEFSTRSNRHYTIEFFKENKQDSVTIPDRKFNFSIYKGHIYSENQPNSSNAIISTEIIN